MKKFDEIELGDIFYLPKTEAIFLSLDLDRFMQDYYTEDELIELLITKYEVLNPPSGCGDFLAGKIVTTQSRWQWDTMTFFRSDNNSFYTKNEAIEWAVQLNDVRILRLDLIWKKVMETLNG